MKDTPSAGVGAPAQPAPTTGGPSPAAAAGAPPPAGATRPPAVTASLAARRAAMRGRLAAFCAVSVVLHGVLIAAYAFMPSSAHAAVDLDAAVVKTRLVKLGKQRDEKLLPRLPTSPPPSPTSKSKPNDSTTQENPKPESPEKKSAADILNDLKKQEKSSNINDIINDRIGEPTDEGREDGDKEGNALDGEIQATYFARVALHVQKLLSVSSVLSDEERVRLRCELTLVLDDDGGLVSAKIQKSSGNPTFDNDVLSAAKRSSPLPAPPPAVRKLATSGFAFNVCPTSCS